MLGNHVASGEKWVRYYKHWMFIQGCAIREKEELKSYLDGSIVMEKLGQS